MFLSRQQVRELDRKASAEFGIPSIVLMENAGREMAQLLLALGIQGPVVVCCGKGNNGGDGFVIARHLDSAGVDVRVLLFADAAELSPDAAINFRIVQHSGIACQVHSSTVVDEQSAALELAMADWVVDALFGSGLRGAIGPPLDRVVAAINAAPGRVLSVDLPSGLDSDTGQPLGPTVRAHHTAAVVAARKGFIAAGADAWLGRVHVVDIGMPFRLIRGAAEAAGLALIPEPA